MKPTVGVFISDVHLPDNTELRPVYHYLNDLYAQVKKDGNRFLIILGGDILDAEGMHGVESLPASAFRQEWYDRDCRLLSQFMGMLKEAAPLSELVFIEGNHEERYCRLMKKYPDAFKGRFDFMRDVVKKFFPKASWIPYGTYKSFFKLGDCLFTHGTIYPESHAKRYALNHAPFKVVYGHLHHYQAFTIHNAMPTTPARYAVTAGCLAELAPEWKKGQPHMWLNGFASFVSINGVTTPTAHIIEKGRFMVGGRIYQ